MIIALLRYFGCFADLKEQNTAKEMEIILSEYCFLFLLVFVEELFF